MKLSIYGAFFRESYYWLNFFNRLPVTLCGKFVSLCLSRNWYISFIKFYVIELFIIVLYHSFNVHEIISDSSTSLLILVTSIFSLSYLAWLEDYHFIGIFINKNILLTFIILLTSYIFLFSFICVLIFLFFCTLQICIPLLSLVS